MVLTAAEQAELEKPYDDMMQSLIRDMLPDMGTCPLVSELPVVGRVLADLVVCADVRVSGMAIAAIPTSMSSGPSSDRSQPKRAIKLQKVRLRSLSFVFPCTSQC